MLGIYGEASGSNELRDPTRKILVKDKIVAFVDYIKTFHVGRDTMIGETKLEYMPLKDTQH